MSFIFGAFGRPLWDPCSALYSDKRFGSFFQKGAALHGAVAFQKEAPRFFADGPVFRLTATSQRLRAAPKADSPTVSELLYGERFFKIRNLAGFDEVISLTDGYRGFVEASCPVVVDSLPTHRIKARSSWLYSAPDIKSAPVMSVPMGAALWGLEGVGAAKSGFLKTADGYIPVQDCVPFGLFAADPVAVAEQFLQSPYLWGGRSAMGIDCSGLVQIALQACGLMVHRDSDLQRASIGRALSEAEKPMRGDLAFFPGHVGLMYDEHWLLHANATHMAVTLDPLGKVIDWVKAAQKSSETRPAFLGWRRFLPFE